MKRIIVLAAGALFGLAGPVLADGAVKVEYLQPEKFTDVRERQFKSAPEKNANLKNLKQWLEKRAAKQLRPDQQLQISFLDIDLAGEFEPWNGPSFQDIRILKDNYPPRMKLRFRLTSTDGALIREGEAELRDLAFLMESPPLRSESLAYDQRLLEDWLRKEFPTEP